MGRRTGTGSAGTRAARIRPCPRSGGPRPRRLRAGHDDETVCVVTHGVPARILILEALGLGLDRIWSLHLAPTGISELEFRADWAALHRMNTLVHLDAVAVSR